jgi:hypothetical protein
MSHFGISQNFRNASVLGRFARTEKETKKDEKDDEKESSSSVSTSKSESQPSATKMMAVTARYVTKSSDHL